MNEKKKWKGIPKRILAFMLTLAMVLTLMPGMNIKVQAANGDIDGLHWELNDAGTLTISGSVEMTYNATKAWENYVSSIKKIVISYGVTSIYNNAFRECSNLDSVT